MSILPVRHSLEPFDRIANGLVSALVLSFMGLLAFADLLIPSEAP